ncbi:MAG: hypothetical protein WC757_04640 [Candidatus Paceibacterota bacterium]|jgi:hypothetical protein
MKTTLVLFCKDGQGACITTPQGETVSIVYRGVCDAVAEIAFGIPVGFELSPNDCSKTVETVRDLQLAQGWIPESRFQDYLGARATQAHHGG